MKKLNNQTGAALVLVLVIITVMMLIIPLLLYQLNSANVQFNKTEEQVQAENIAEMGVEYFNLYVEQNIENDAESIDLSFLQAAGDNILLEVEIEAGAFYKIQLNELPENNPITEKGDYTITFTSIGNAKDTTEELTRTITITVE